MKDAGMYHMHAVLRVLCKATSLFGWLLMMHCALPETVVTTAQCFEKAA